MAFPADALDIAVELAFGADLTADPATWVWTDVGADTLTGEGTPRLLRQSLSISRGRSDEASQAAPASFSVSFDNSDGNLTPQNASSKWYPNVRRGTPIRVTVESTHVRFVGQVGEIAPAWPEGDRETANTIGWATVRIVAGGIMRRLGQGSKPVMSPMRRYFSEPSYHGTPIAELEAYWPLEDDTQRSSTIAGVPAVISRGMDFGQSTTLLGSAPLPTANSDGAYIRASLTTPVGPAAGETGWLVRTYMSLASIPAGSQQILGIRTSGDVVRWTIHTTSTTITYRGYNAAGAVAHTTTAAMDAGLFEQDWVEVVFYANQSGTTVTASFEMFGGGYSAGGSLAPFTGDVGAVTQVTVYAAASWGIGHLGIFSASDALGIPALGVPTDGHAGEAGSTRANRIGDEFAIDIDADSASFGALTAYMGPQPRAGVLDILFDTAAAQDGVLSEQVDGYGLTYRPRGSLYNQTPALTLDASADEIANPFAPIDDDQRLRNEVTATRPLGGSVTVNDEDHIEAEGLYDEAVTVNVESDDQLSDIAAWRLYLGTWAGMRYPSVTVDLGVAPARIAEAVAVRQGDLIRITGLPSQHPAGDVDLIVHGWTETLSRETWELTFNCTPGEPWEVAVLEDSELGRADTEGSSLSAAVDENDTSLTVATASGPAWVTTAANPGEFPFDIDVGGEVMTVTAIAGATSPQTFTVTRSVNGVEKAHSIGAAVSLAHSMTLAL